MTIQLLNLDGKPHGEAFSTAFDVANGMPDILRKSGNVYMRQYASMFADLNGPKVFKQVRIHEMDAGHPNKQQRAILLDAAANARGFTKKAFDPAQQIKDHVQCMDCVKQGWLTELPRGGFMITAEGRKAVKR